MSTNEPDMDLATGMAAFEAKEFTRAKQFLSRYAEDGMPEAQHRMAIMLLRQLEHASVVICVEYRTRWVARAANIDQRGTIKNFRRHAGKIHAVAVLGGSWYSISFSSV